MKSTFRGLVLATAVGWAAVAHGDVSTVSVSLMGTDEDPVLTRANLIQIRQFILAGGQTSGLFNAFAEVPAYTTEKWGFYLFPDDLGNRASDPKESGFHRLVVRWLDGGRNQYRHIIFTDEHRVVIEVPHPSDDLSVGQIRRVAAEAMVEILARIEVSEN